MSKVNTEKSVFESWKLGNLTLKNRIIKAELLKASPKEVCLMKGLFSFMRNLLPVAQAW